MYECRTWAELLKTHSWYRKKWVNSWPNIFFSVEGGTFSLRDEQYEGPDLVWVMGPYCMNS